MDVFPDNNAETLEVIWWAIHQILDNEKHENFCFYIRCDAFLIHVTQMCEWCNVWPLLQSTICLYILFFYNSADTVYPTYMHVFILFVCWYISLLFILLEISLYTHTQRSTLDAFLWYIRAQTHQRPGTNIHSK